MSAPPPKRLRTSAIRSCILASFTLPTAHPPPLSAPPPPASPPSLHSSVLLSALACTSTSSGLSAAAAVASAVLDHTLSVPQLLSALLDDDDAPPTCVLATLLESPVRASDLPPAALATHLASSLSRHCACVGSGVPSALVRIVEAIVADGPCGARDAAIGSLVRVVTVSGAGEESFCLAKETFSALSDVDMNEDDRVTLLSTWVRAAVCATSLAAELDLRDECAGSSHWSLEMSAIATGEKPLQYLASLDMEEELLNYLFGSVSPGISTEVLTSVLHSFFHRNEDGTVDAVAGSLGSLNWPRLLLLVSRILDSRLWDDADKSERAKIDACLHLGLCLPSVAREPRLVAAVVTVGRYVSVCGRNIESVDDAERGYREYDKWLGQTVNVGNKATIKSLVAYLTHLVPIEPSRFLRANVKTLLRSRRGDIVGDYIALEKTKLADIDADPAADNDGDGVAARADAERDARAIGDVMKYVVDFLKGNSVMPASLVRQMTFHTYHFRASVLEPLLSVDLSPSPEFLEAHIPDATIQTFNKKRIAMIKQMAFKRKDKAVTKEEATAAVEQINAKMRALSAEGAGAAGVDATRALDCHLTADSSPESLIRGLALSASVPSTVARSTADGNASVSQPASDRLCGLLASKLASMGRAKDADVMKIVSLVLETVLQEIFSSSRPCYRRGKAGLKPDGARKRSDSRGDLLHRTVDTPVPWVNRFLVDVLGDCRLAGQRHALQQRLLVLLYGGGNGEGRCGQWPRAD